MDKAMRPDEPHREDGNRTELENEEARTEMEAQDGLDPGDGAGASRGEPRVPVHSPDPNRELTTADLAGRTSADPRAARPEPKERPTPLMAENIAGGLRNQWDTIQTGFVDEPRQAVERADNLVAETMKRLAESFADERAKLERQWDLGDEVSTEDLRLALQRYRSFFQRLLAI